MGRGQPVIVAWQQSGTKGFLRVREPIVTMTSPRTTCQTTQWNIPTAVSLVTWVNLTDGLYEKADEIMQDGASPPTTRPYSEICYTPMGRAYIRFATTGAFQPQAGVASFTVTNSDTGLQRKVFIPPNGLARLQL
jgi:type IV fimbrial biogenesis protein FimT